MSDTDPKLDGIERRQNERIPAKMAVRFSRKEDAARALRAYSLNLSVGGLCLRTQKTYAIGDKLELNLEAEGETFALQGVVAWVRQSAIGVRFVNVTPDVSARLTQIVAALKKS